MRRFLLLILPGLAACGGGSLTLEGTLADTTAATEVWAMGRAERVPVANGAFRLDDVEGDTVELRFTTGADSQVRMLLHDLPDGGTLRLEGIWFADEVAFPARLAGGNAAPTVVNGLRMAAGDAVPRDVNLPGTVLAMAEDGDALLLRPDDAALPDLNVLITPASVVRTADGDLVDPEQLEFGDSLRLSGIGDGGQVIAAEILVSRRVAANDDDASLGSGRAEDDPEPAPALLRSASVTRAPSTPAPAVSEEDDDSDKREERLEKQLERASERAREKVREIGRGRGKGKGRD